MGNYGTVLIMGHAGFRSSALLSHSALLLLPPPPSPRTRPLPALLLLPWPKITIPRILAQSQEPPAHIGGLNNQNRVLRGPLYYHCNKGALILYHCNKGGPQNSYRQLFLLRPLELAQVLDINPQRLNHRSHDPPQLPGRNRFRV